jgi:hypothetical protein
MWLACWFFLQILQLKIRSHLPTLRHPHDNFPQVRHGYRNSTRNGHGIRAALIHAWTHKPQILSIQVTVWPHDYSAYWGANDWASSAANDDLTLLFIGSAKPVSSPVWSSHWLHCLSVHWSTSKWTNNYSRSPTLKMIGCVAWNASNGTSKLHHHMSLFQLVIQEVTFLFALCSGFRTLKCVRHSLIALKWDCP